jgi:hypothetical protein
MADQVLDDEIAGFPAWIKPGLSVKAGREVVP